MKSLDITIRQTGYGHWKVTVPYYNREVSAVTTNSMAIDDFNSEDWEKDGRELRKLRGYKALRGEAIRKHKEN